MSSPLHPVYTRTPASGTGGSSGGTPSTVAAFQNAHLFLAKADTVPFNYFACGDSVTEGTGAGDNLSSDAVQTGPYFDQRYIAVLTALLQRQWTTVGQKASGATAPGGLGFVNTFSNVNNGSSVNSAYWVMSGGGSGANSDGFLGARYYNFASSETATLHFTGTSFIIHSQRSNSTALSISITIDGGGAIPITIASGAGNNNQFTWDSVTGPGAPGALSAGTHTVVITQANTLSTLFIKGVTIRNGDDANGIRCWDNGHFGDTSGTYTSGNGAGTISKMTDALTLYPAHLVSIELGLNDYQQNIDPLTTKANIQTLISNIKGLVTGWTPSFLLLIPYQRGDVSTPTFPWSQYVAAMTAIAAADPTNVATIDFSARIPTPVIGNSYARGLINSDGVHPVRSGAKLIGMTTANTLQAA